MVVERSRPPKQVRPRSCLEVDRTGAGVPGREVDPALGLLGPFVQVHAPEGVLGAGQGDRLLGLAREIVLLDREAEARVGLAPDLRVGPVVALVGGGDEREPAVVLQGAFQQLDRIVVVLEADAVAVVAGGGDLEQQRLAPGAGGGLQHVDHVAGLVGVQLVDDRAMHVQAVHGAGIGGERHEARGAGLDVQVVDQHLDPALERRRGADHALGLVEHDARLIAGGGGGVDLGALLAVGDQEVERDAGGQRALAVLARHGAVGGAEAAQAIGALPAEQRADHERLPGSEGEGLAGPLALGVAQEAEEVDGMLRRLRIEAQAPRRTAGEVVEMARAGQADQAVGEDLPLGHRPCVGGDRVVSGGSSHGFAGTPRRDPRAACRRPGSGCGSWGSCRTRRRSAP